MNKKGFSVSTYVGLSLLSLTGASIYLLPYIRWSYYDALLAACGLNNTQFGLTMSVFGTVSLVGYFVGGIVADRFPAKILLCFSLVGVGLLGFWFSTFPGFGAQLFIYACWGGLTTITFWAALQKATRQMGDSSEQGKLFGFVEGGRGILSAIISFVALYFFSKLGESLGGLKGIIIGMSVLAVVTGVLVLFLLKGREEDEEGTADAQSKPSLADLIVILKNPVIWMISIVVLACYSVYVAGTYLTPYFTNVIGATASFAAMLSVMRSYVLQFVCGPLGGALADKMKSITKVIVACYVVFIATLFVIILLPTNKSAMVPLVIVLIVLYASIFAMRGIYFATMDEANIPMKMMGTAVGVVSVIGFSPDVFMNAICGNLLDRFEGAAGYKVIFALMLGFSVVGLIAAFLLLKSTAKKIKK